MSMFYYVVPFLMFRLGKWPAFWVDPVCLFLR